MSQTLKLKIQTPTDEQIWVACGSCGKATCHNILASIETSDESADGFVQVWDDYKTIQCGGCKSISYCTQSQCSEDFEFNHETEQDELTLRTRLYPSRVAGRPILENVNYLPHIVYKIYTESHTALCGDQPVLTSIGIRAIIETICKDKSISGVNLKERIDNLSVAGLITTDGAKILHSLRFMGNEAAHEVKTHTSTELSTAMEVTEYLLKGVYILPKLANKLPAKP